MLRCGVVVVTLLGEGLFINLKFYSLMKKMMFMMLLWPFFSVVGIAQENQKPADVDFYGIDFSKVTVSGVKESVGQFVSAFKGMNLLFVSESEKYDLSRFLGFNVLETNISISEQQVESWQQQPFWNTAKQDLTAEDFAGILGAYPETETPGLLIVAQWLDKKGGIGYFKVVAFDGQTKQILWSRDMQGEAGGAGLRNYWAGSVYDGLENLQKQLKKESRRRK